MVDESSGSTAFPINVFNSNAAMCISGQARGTEQAGPREGATSFLLLECLPQSTINPRMMAQGEGGGGIRGRLHVAKVIGGSSLHLSTPGALWSATATIPSVWFL